MDNQNKKENTSVIVSYIIVVAVIGLFVYILMHKSPKENPLEDIKSGEMTETQQPAIDPNLGSSSTTQNMDQVAKNGDTLVMNYTGKLTNGTVFDSNVDPKFNHVTPFEFQLGAGQVIKGWDEGLVGMKVGEKKTLTISPDKGYGNQAVSTIPANSTLIFDVELVGIK